MGQFVKSATIIVTEVASFVVCRLSTSVATEFQKTYLDTRHSRS